MRYIFYHSNTQGLVLDYSDSTHDITRWFVGYTLREAIKAFRAELGLALKKIMKMRRSKTMKLLTKEIEEKFKKFPIYSQDGKGYEAEVLVKYFNPQGVGTWLITEAEKMTAEKDGTDDWLLFGLCEIGGEWEWGPVLLSTLQNFIGRYGLGIERDLYLDKGTKVKDLM